jgi:hypothetical protein
VERQEKSFHEEREGKVVGVREKGNSGEGNHIEKRQRGREGEREGEKKGGREGAREYLCLHLLHGRRLVFHRFPAPHGH